MRLGFFLLNSTHDVSEPVKTILNAKRNIVHHSFFSFLSLHPHSPVGRYSSKKFILMDGIPQVILGKSLNPLVDSFIFHVSSDEVLASYSSSPVPMFKIFSSLECPFFVYVSNCHCFDNRGFQFMVCSCMILFA